MLTISYKRRAVCFDRKINTVATVRVQNKDKWSLYYRDVRCGYQLVMVISEPLRKYFVDFNEVLSTALQLSRHFFNFFHIVKLDKFSKQHTLINKCEHVMKI